MGIYVLILDDDIATTFSLERHSETPSAETTLPPIPRNINWTIVEDTLFPILRSGCAARSKHLSPMVQRQVQLGFALLEWQGLILLPMAGTLLGAVRHGMLCAPWDDDLDVLGCEQKAYDALLDVDVERKSDISGGVVDVTATDQGHAMRVAVNASETFTKQGGRVITFRVNPQGTLPFVREYFSGESKVHQKALLVIAAETEWDFFKLRIVEEATTGTPQGMGIGEKLTDVFAPKRALLPSDVSLTLLSKPEVLENAKWETIEGVRLRMPKRPTSSAYLDEKYGPTWNSEALVCGGHGIIADISECQKTQRQWPATTMAAAGSRVEECCAFAWNGEK